MFLKENQDLRRTVAQFKAKSELLQDRLDKLEGKRRFEPSQAFQMKNKENLNPSK